MYHASDPRSALASPETKKKQPVVAFHEEQYAKFYETEPQEHDDKGATWYARGQNFIIAYTDAKAGAVLSRKDQPDEYIIILPDADTVLEIVTPDETKTVNGYSVTVVPPGESTVTVVKAGKVHRMFSSFSRDIAEKCSNASAYLTPDPNVPPLELWPEPKDGFRIRSYSLDIPQEQGRFGRIFRCTTFMVNYLDPKIGPRDPRIMSPHHHDDFEQCSLAVQGSFIHHVRWPWTTDSTIWREDRHELCHSPSFTVIPPPSIHTSQAIDPVMSQLIDVFCPPRVDFSLKPGWVLNADEYPMPGEE